MNYTLYCVSERGALTDEGFALPFLVLLAAHIVIVTAGALAVGLSARTRTDTPAATDVPGATELRLGRLPSTIIGHALGADALHSRSAPVAQRCERGVQCDAEFGE